MKLLVAVAIFGAVLAATPASATHDTIYTPSSTEYGYVHMTYEEWAAEITAMEADAWATALLVLGSEKGLQLAKQENLAALFVERGPSGIKVLTTANFPR